MHRTFWKLMTAYERYMTALVGAPVNPNNKLFGSLHELCLIVFAVFAMVELDEMSLPLHKFV